METEKPSADGQPRRADEAGAKRPRRAPSGRDKSEAKGWDIKRWIAAIILAVVAGAATGFVYATFTDDDARDPGLVARCSKYNITPDWISAINVTYRMPDGTGDIRELYYLDRPRHTPDTDAKAFVEESFNTTERGITILDAEYVHTHLDCIEREEPREELDYG